MRIIIEQLVGKSRETKEELWQTLFLIRYNDIKRNKELMKFTSTDQYHLFRIGVVK